MTRWRGEPDPAHVKAVDAYFVSAAEHGMNASTFTARVIASTGADVAAAMSGAIGAMSGPLHGGAPARVLPMIEEVEKTGDAKKVVTGILDRHERLMGFGHRVYRAEDPRARVLRRTCKELNSPLYDAANALEQAALTQLRERSPSRPVETNVEFWAAVILDFAEVPPHMMPAMFTCARTAGWSAHILEQKRMVQAGSSVRALRRTRPAQAGRGRGLGRYRSRIDDIEATHHRNGRSLRWAAPVSHFGAPRGSRVSLSTHVLDTALGRPAVGVSVALFRQADGAWVAAGSGPTDADGRVTDLPCELGIWQLRFATGDYFARTGQRGFFPEVAVTFEVTDAGAHHHVPLLLSPFSYSTYRGS